jgi:integrase
MEAPLKHLRLFRRHEAACLHGYAKEFRIYESDVEKRKGKTSVKDCTCPISAEGSLIHPDGRKHYLRPKSTGERTWENAKARAAAWEAQGDVQPLAEYQDPRTVLVSVEDAGKEFLRLKNGQNLDSETIKQHTAWVGDRLVPFAERHGIANIQQMDNAKVWADFRYSWVNLNPFKNRKPKTGDELKLTLGPRTAKRLLSTTRNFIRFAISREWLTKEWASKQYGLFISTSVEPKEPFSDEELEYIYKATSLKTDGKGFRTKRTKTRNGDMVQNAWEILVFLWTLQYTGLRISDAVQLESNQLVRFENFGYTHAIAFHPQKTHQSRQQGNFVHIPIPNGNFPGHPNLVKALQDLPLKHGRYFFRGGTTDVGYDITNWGSRVQDIFTLAEKLMAQDGKAFLEHPHPHKMRHTFAARLLQAGVSLRIVAQYLGDTEATVRKHYAKFCLAEQVEAASVMATVHTREIPQLRLVKA